MKPTLINHSGIKREYRCLHGHNQSHKRGISTASESKSTLLISWFREIAPKQGEEILYLILASTGSQCRVRRGGVMWSVLGAFKMRRAALFWTLWSLFRSCQGHPERKELSSPVVKERKLKRNFDGLNREVLAYRAGTRQIKIWSLQRQNSNKLRLTDSPS